MTPALRLKPSVIFMAMLMAGSATVQADDANAFIDDSNTDFNLRYRLETVDEDAKTEDAIASTLKARITWNSGKVNGFKINAELDHVMTLGADDYNDTTGTSTNTAYPVVADPTGTDLNQLNISYQNDGLTLIAGRQRIVLGNQRFVGGVAWRQNEQTYDGVRAKFKANEKLSFDYSYIATVNRIFGPDGPKKELEGGFQLFNADYQIDKSHKLTGFAYLLDVDGASDSQNTFGVDYNGKFDGFSAHASFAMQSMGDFDANYFALDATKGFGSVQVTLGMEQLGSDKGNYSFSTPLATAHKFQGFADKFLGTPANGVNDYYVKVATKVKEVKLAATYHSFSAVEGDADYGTELDLVASYKVHKTTSLLAKFASYSADDHASDTTKFWFMANTKF